MPGAAPRYAWVLAGPHVPASSEQAEPRAEFNLFQQRYGGALLSRSSLAGPLPPLPAALRKLGWPVMSLASLVQAEAGRFDAIIASGEDIGVPVALAGLARFSRVPVHVLFHGHHLESVKLRALAPLLRQVPQLHLHCLSAALRARAMAVLGLPPGRVHATGYGVDTRYFTPTAPGEEALIASAGAARRDYATLAEAVSPLPVALRIAADSTWKPPGEGMAARPWPANVSVRSYGDYARLRALYAAARFVVVPLHPAPHACGYAVMAEAMAMGRAVIATRTAAPPDFLLHGATGLFVEPHDSVGLRAAIRSLLDHPEEAAAMGQRASALMQAEHSLERYCARLEQAVAASLPRAAPVVQARWRAF